MLMAHARVQIPSETKKDDGGRRQRVKNFLFRTRALNCQNVFGAGSVAAPWRTRQRKLGPAAFKVPVVSASNRQPGSKLSEIGRYDDYQFQPFNTRIRTAVALEARSVVTRVVSRRRLFLVLVDSRCRSAPDFDEIESGCSWVKNCYCSAQIAEFEVQIVHVGFRLEQLILPLKYQGRSSMMMDEHILASFNLNHRAFERTTEIGAMACTFTFEPKFPLRRLEFNVRALNRATEALEYRRSGAMSGSYDGVIISLNGCVTRFGSIKIGGTCAVRVNDMAIIPSFRHQRAPQSGTDSNSTSRPFLKTPLPPAGKLSPPDSIQHLRRSKLPAGDFRVLNLKMASLYFGLDGSWRLARDLDGISDALRRISADARPFFKPSSRRQARALRLQVEGMASHVCNLHGYGRLRAGVQRSSSAERRQLHAPLSCEPVVLPVLLNYLNIEYTTLRRPPTDDYYIDRVHGSGLNTRLGSGLQLGASQVGYISLPRHAANSKSQNSIFRRPANFDLKFSASRELKLVSQNHEYATYRVPATDESPVPTLQNYQLCFKTAALANRSDSRERALGGALRRLYAFHFKCGGLVKIRLFDENYSKQRRHDGFSSRGRLPSTNLNIYL
ncbi:hypothetical protein R3P38DRAFT_3345854 [Favolaschia claudopus]|uniref:Uncharacterized protein n=1 Tax=Favolaschia claudopus TaxID=2862362 RepID=A0AAW0DC32_9AGAR